jgi:MFS family permease
MIASSYTLAAAFMSCVVMLIGMPLGRRRCIIIGNVFIAIGGVVQATSYSVPQIIVARVLCVSNALDFLRSVELMSV